MKELKSMLRGILGTNPTVASLLPAGATLIFIYPALEFVESCARTGFITNVFLGIFYVLYLAGLLFCFAQDQDLLIGIAFSIRACSKLVSLVIYPTLTTFILLAFYVVLAVYFIREFVLASQTGAQGGYTNQGMGYQNRQSAPQTITHCPGCGQPVEDGSFCPFCGTPYGTTYNNAYNNAAYGNAPAYNRSNAGFSGNAGLSAASSYQAGSIWSLSSSKLVLVLAIAYSLTTLIGLVNGISFTGIIAAIPAIIVCVGLWLIYVGAMQGNLKTTGFSLINGVLTFDLVVALIAPIIFIIILFISFIALSQEGGSDGAGALIIMILFFILAIVFYWFYFNGLRKTTKAARSLVKGEYADLHASMYVIVLLIISAVGKVISFIGLLSARAALSEVVNALNAGYGSIEDIMGYNYGYSEYDTSMIYSVLNNLTGPIKSYLNSLISPLQILTSLCSMVTVIVAIIILFKIREQHKVNNVVD